MLGYRADEVIGNSSIQLGIWVDPEDRKRLTLQLQEQGSVNNLEALLRRKSGLIITALVSSRLIELNGEQCTLNIARDITELKKADEERLLLERQLQHTQKMESLGVLAGGIAHDFNNLLAIIIGRCSLASIKPETAEGQISSIEKAARRAAELCRQMLAYAGKSNVSRVLLNMGDLVYDMVDMLRATIKQNVSITLDNTAKICFINGDASQIRQVVMNLIINAADAIGDDQGEISVSLTRILLLPEHSEKDYLGAVIAPAEYICLEVTDNGSGMDEETKRRIFEPFYTTKFTGRGLGMAAVLGIITGHKGALQLHSQQGHGSTFKVFLPPVRTGRRSESMQSVEPYQWRGNGKVLLVEDEEHVMSVASEMLQELGFTVIEAKNGSEALSRFQKNFGDITVVLTDIDMPVMDGYTLFRELKTLKPELPIIIATGFGDIDVSSRIGREEIAGLASKPYSLDQLRDVMSRV
jgi:signal transduction histidine kinase/CheY-like chemotaxis protein